MTQLNFRDFRPAETSYQTVSELTRRIKVFLEGQFDDILIVGEISNFTHHGSGHMYFSLKDESAQIACVMWRSRNAGLFFTPQDGMRVTIHGRVSVYEKRGNYQLNVLDMQPAGVGELQMAFERLKRRLHEEGLFDDARKKPLPAFPQRIGIVTSPTGAAIQDLLNVLRRRNPAVEIILNPARVQGDGAAQEIAQAIDDFNELQQVDLLIVGRGGGSLEDLWPFNEEVVARAVYRSEIPIISAVGHEVDYTICDFVADLRAPTPSAAAELAVPVNDDLKQMLMSGLADMRSALLDRIAALQEKINAIRTSYAFGQPADLIYQSMQRVDDMRRSLDTALQHRLSLTHEKLSGLSQRLTLLEHTNVLKRGYSLCFHVATDRLVREAGEFTPGDAVRVKLYRGEIRGSVDEVQPE